MKSSVDIGTKFQKWTTTTSPFLKLSSSGKKVRYVSVKCQCSKVGLVKLASLTSGKSSGCRSCAKKSTRTYEQLKETAVKSIILDYKDNASVRGLQFNLTDEEFKNLIFLKCHYCDSGPSNVKKTKKVKVAYNGIDRIDSNLGYSLSNCVPCCSICNIMKRHHDSSFFVEHITKILNKNKLNTPLSTKKLEHLHERAITISAQSHDVHTKVAALLINPKTLAISSDGYNGFVRNAADAVLPTSRPEKYDYMVHAEANLLCNAVRNGVKTDSCFVYVTLSPCTFCLRLMWQAGIREFYFKEKYKDFDKCTSMLDLEVQTSYQDGFYHMLVDTRKHA